MSDNQEDLQQRIAAYIDGELSPAEAARLEVFLANTDPKLADSIVGMLADKVQIRALPRMAPPPDLAGRIMEQIERNTLLREDDTTPKRSWWQSRAAIAAGLAVVLGGFSYFVATSVRHPRADDWASATAPSAPLAEADTTPRDMAKGAGNAATNDQKFLAAGGVPSPVVAPSPAPSAPTAEPGALSKGSGPGGSGPGGATESEALKPDARGLLAQGREIPASPKAAVDPATAATSPATSPMIARHEGTLDGSGSDVPMTQQLAMADGRGAPGAVSPDISGPAPGGARTARGGAAPGFAGGAGGGGAGFGGGGGGFGGGRGGRGGGGAGPVATPAAPAVTAAPLSIAGMQTITPTADNTLQALAAIARDGKGPLVVTLYAKDEQDYSRLVSTLAGFAAVNMPNDNLNGVAQIAAPADPRNGVQSVNPGQSGLTQNGQVVTQSGAPAQYKYNGTVTMGISKEGVVTFDAPANLGLDGSSLRVSNGPYLNQSQVNNDNFINRANVYVDPQIAPQNINSEQARDNAVTLQTIQQAAARGGPYRLGLRAQQLEDLSKIYRVAVVARGDLVVQFHTVGDQTPQAADLEQRRALLARAGLDRQGQSVTLKDEQASANTTLNVNGGTLQAGPPAATAPAVAGALKAQAEPLLDCVITMENEPGQAPPPAANQQAPARVP